MQHPLSRRWRSQRANCSAKIVSDWPAFKRDELAHDVAIFIFFCPRNRVRPTDVDPGIWIWVACVALLVNGLNKRGG